MPNDARRSHSHNFAQQESGRFPARAAIKNGWAPCPCVVNSQRLISGSAPILIPVLPANLKKKLRAKGIANLVEPLKTIATEAQRKISEGGG